MYGWINRVRNLKFCEGVWGGVEHFENKKKYEEKKKANPNSDEMKINRFWLRKSIA